MENVNFKLLEFENVKMLKKMSIFLIISLGLMYLGIRNYLAFHVISELYSSMVAFMMASISINTFKINKNNRIMFLGIAYGFIALLDLIHMMSYKGMGILGDETSNIPTQLWIAARYMESLSFTAFFTLSTKKLNLRKILNIYISISILILASIFTLKIFPNCYIEGHGLTSFKIISEYIICGILFVNMIIFIKGKEKRLNKNDMFVVYSLVATIISEIFFVFYVDVYSISNIIGHIFKILSFYLIYIALVQSNLREPYLGLVELNNLLDNKNKKLEDLILRLKLEMDIRQKLETENLEKKEILDAVLESSMDGMLVVSNSGQIIHSNKLLMKMWNMPQGALVHSDYNMIFQTVRSQLDNPEEFDDFINRSWTQQVSRICELSMKDGRAIEASSVSLMSKDMNIGKVISFRDITRRNEILELQKEIEIKQILLEKAREFDEIKNNFFSTISHEFRTPLNIILGIVQLLPLLEEKNKGQEYKEKFFLDKYANIVKQNCYRLIKLANNFIDISKIDAGYMELNLRNYNIVSLVEDITLSIVEYSNSKGIILIFDTEVEELMTACDADKLERIILNLLSNAIKFVEPGGEVKVTVKEEKESVIISVKDNGVGIPKDMLETIFDRFKQVDSTLTRKREGSGIGLSIVKSLTEIHGGNVNLYSEIGRGSEFVITLPIKIVQEDEINLSEYMVKEINVDRINIEFSDIYELN